MNEPSSPAVLMLTGQGDINTARKAVQLGAYDFLFKPFDSDYLRMNVAAKLRSMRSNGAAPGR